MTFLEPLGNMERDSKTLIWEIVSLFVTAYQVSNECNSGRKSEICFSVPLSFCVVVLLKEAMKIFFSTNFKSVSVFCILRNEWYSNIRAKR